MLWASPLLVELPCSAEDAAQYQAFWSLAQFEASTLVADGHGKVLLPLHGMPGQHWLPAHWSELPGHCVLWPA